MIKKVYWDVTERPGSIGIIGQDIEMIPAGATVSAMSIREKNTDYQIFADQHDIRFIFDDDIPSIDFYPVPRVDVFATDSAGGLLGTVGETIDLNAATPICHIDQSGTCSWVADSLSELLKLLASGRSWKTAMAPYCGVVFYKSIQDARQALDFISLPCSG